jgi:hypothetical protein
MGASIAEGGFDDDEDYAEAHEINVTPFIDVILVPMPSGFFSASRVRNGSRCSP